jgi:hypothetical protein
MSKAGTFWRAAGMNYLQYLGVASGVVRASLKVNIKYFFLSIDPVDFCVTYSYNSDTRLMIHKFI